MSENSELNYFEEHYERYDEWYEEHKKEYQDQLDFIRELIPKGKGLEIGVGTGRFASELGIEYGIDNSEAMIQKAMDRGIKCLVADAQDIPFTDSSFDYTFYMVTLCFLSDPLKSLREAKRISRKVIAVILDKNSEYIQKIAKERKGFYKYAKFYSKDELMSMYHTLEFRNIVAKEKELVTSDGLKYKLVAVIGY